MKQEASKKSKLWIWLAVGIVAVVAVVGLVLALVLGGGQGQQTGPVGGRPDIYWNIDRDTYMENSLTGLSTREPESDGNFYITFAYNGEQVKLKIVDKRLVNFIDSMDVMGLVKDADGVVIDAVDVTTIATEVGKNIYVQKVDGNTIVANSSIGMNGMQVKIAVTDLTQVYDVTGEGELVGEKIDPSDLKPMDAIAVYANDKEENTHLYRMSYPQATKLYWRADQKYDATNKTTTRVPDENGAYTVPFFCEGERVELKCKDVGLVSAIDYRSSWCPDFGFLFDEEGYIIESIDPAAGQRMVRAARRVDITSIDGNVITAENLGNFDGAVDSYTFTLTDDCIIYDASLVAKGEGRQGKPTDSLEVGDRINVWTDPSGNAKVIYIGMSMIDSPIYYNITRMYAESGTTRTPNAQGFYEMEVMVDGEIKTLKCMDKATVDRVDNTSYKLFTAKVNGDIIEYAYSYQCAYGNSYLCNGYTVSTVTGVVFSAENADGSKAVNGIMNPECKVYDVSGVSGPIGTETKLQVGDKIIAPRNVAGEVMRIYITSRSKEAYCSHCKQTVTWYSYNGGSIAAGDTHYYLAGDVNQGSQVTVGNADLVYEIVLDLNGHTLSRTDGAGRVLLSYLGSTFTVMDTKGGGKIMGCGKTNLSGSVVLINNGTFNLLSGTIGFIDSEQCNPRGGIMMLSGSKSVFNMYGGTITGGVAKATEKYSPGNGGNIWNYQGTVNMYGGTVSNGTADRGGNIYLTGGSTFNLSGGTVTGGFASNRAGNLYVGGDCVANITGGTISNGTAGRFGGNIGIYSESTVNISGGEILDGYVDGSVDGKSGYAGNIYLYVGHLNISGGKISGGKVNTDLETSYTGNIYVYGDAIKDDKGNVTGKYETSLTISGGEITGGKAKSYANIMVRSGEYADVKLSGGTIDGAFTVSGPKSFVISGSPKIGTVGGGLNIKEGVLATLGEMSKGADICVSATGAFTEPVKNAKSYLSYFWTATRATAVYVDANGALAVGEASFDADAYNEIHAQSIAMTFSGGTDTKTCPYCEEEVVWMPLTNASALKLSDDSYDSKTHFYLAEDLEILTNLDVDIAQACIHLNGHNITQGANSSKNAPALLCNSGKTMNIMGDGVVIGRGVGYSESGITWNGGVVASRGTTNLFGGTYMCAEGRDRPALSTYINKNATINMFEGTKVQGNPAVSATARSSCVYVLSAEQSFNMYGGSITGGRATKGGNLQLLAGNAYIGGGVIEGDVYVAEGAKLTLAENAVISETNGGLDLTSGAVVTLENLTAEANINVTVNKNTDFTNALSDEQAAIALTVVKGEGINVLQNESTKALYAVAASGGEGGEGGEGSDDQLTDIEKLNKVYTDAVAMQSLDGVVGVFDTATAAGQTTVEAECPKCGETVTWLGIGDDESTYTLSDASYNGATHFYLTEDITLTGTEQFIVRGDISVCVHLNDRNVTQTGVVQGGNPKNLAAFLGRDAGVVLNIMGDGKVIGRGSGASSGGISWKAGGAVEAWGSTVNLFGGTYQCAAGRSMPVISTFVAENSTVNMYEGTVVLGNPDSTATDYTPNVYILGATHSFNMYGGVIANGQATNGGNICAKAGTVNIAGGMILGGTATEKGNNIYVVGENTALNISDAIIDGGVYVAADAAATVSGTANITNTDGGLDLTSGAKVTLGELVEGAMIYVNVAEETAFTVDNDNAAAYTGYFQSIDPVLITVAQDKALYFVDVYENAVEMQSTDTTTGVFDAATAAGQTTVEALCPKCGETVTWQAIGQDTENKVLSSYGNVTHFFLAEDISWETKNYRLSTAADGNAEVCLHLNNKNFTQAGTANVRALYTVANTTMNVMGDGVITGRAYLYNDTTYMGVVDAEGTVNIFGGIYKDTKGLAILATRGSKNPAINMYAGTVESTLGTTSDAKSSVVRLSGATHTFNLYGGTITGGIAKQGGNVYMSMGNFNMYGGTVTNGQANQGGNFWIGADGVLLIQGGTIQNGLENNAANANNGGNIFVFNGGTVEMIDGAIIGGNATTSGGNVYMTSPGCTFAMYGGEMSGGKAGTHGGQMFSNSAEAVIAFYDVTISGGEAGARGGNFYISGASTSVEIVGATVENGTAGTWGGNICINSPATTAIIYESTVTGGTAGELGNSIYCVGHLGIENSTVDGDVYMVADAIVAVAGKVAIGTAEGGVLDLTQGVVFTPVELTEDAVIYVTANADQVIAEAEGVEAYAANFKCAEGFAVTGTEGKLTYGAVVPTP